MKWERVPLAKISEVVTKGTTPTTLGRKFVNSGIPFLRAQNINELNVIFSSDILFIDDETNNLLARSQILSNDILLSIAGTIGRSAVVPNNAPRLNCNQAVAIIRPKIKAIYPYFLKYWLDTKDAQNQIYGAKVTATISNLSLSQIKQLKIPIPPIEEQKRIATILDKADAIRRKREKAVEFADDFLKTVFLDMFGDPATNPKQWPIGTIRDLVSEVKYGTSKKADESNGEYPILRMNNITYEGYLNLKNLKYVDLDEKEKSKYLALKGDLLFNRTNSKELVGKTAVYNQDTPMAIAGYLIRVRSNNKSNPYYLSAYLNSKHGKVTLLNMCKSIVGMANINAQEFQNIKILIPPVDLQNKYEKIVQRVTHHKSKLNDLFSESNSLFSSLSQRAFRGDL